MPATDLWRIAEFQMSFARRQAAVVQEVPGGVVVLDPEYAASYEHNQLIIDGHLIIDGQPVGGGTMRSVELPKVADKLLGHLPYRQITILDDATGTVCAPVLAGAGYAHEIILVMTHAGEVPVPDLAAEQVTVSELRPALIPELCAWLPQASDLVFLLAEADDWPRTWYARLGFTAIGRSHIFTRSASVA